MSIRIKMGDHDEPVNSSASNINKVTALGEKIDNRCSKSSSSRLAALDRFAAKYAIEDRAPLDKLSVLIHDRITSGNEDRIGRLLRDFLRQVGQDGGYRVADLGRITGILEFLAVSSRDIETYRIHLERMLEFCKVPPLLDKTSDRICHFGDTTRYFDTLGHLTSALPADRQIAKLLEALTSLASRSLTSSSLDLKLCRDAMDRSDLATFVVDLCRSSSPQIYEKTLDFALALGKISEDSRRAMLEAGILDDLLARMAESQDSAECADPSGEDVPPRSTNVALHLALSILPPGNMSGAASKFRGPSIRATRNLRDIFRHRVTHARGNNESRTVRNELATLILAGLAADPPWESARRGLADDLIALSVVDESVIEGTCPEKHGGFDANNRDLIFKKILLAALYHLSSYKPAIATMAEKRVVAAILETISPRRLEGETRRWSQAQFSNLSQFAARILPRLTKQMPEEFVRNGGSARLSMLLERSLNAESVDLRLAMELASTICAIATSECPIVLENLREEGTARVLIGTIDRILTFDSLTLRQHQRTITLLLTAIEEITKTEGERVRSCENNSPDGLDTVIRLLHRCHRPKKADSPLDQRLLVAIGSYIWERVTRCPERGRKFVNEGGIYAMLDATEKSLLSVRCLYFGILTDMTIDELYGGAVLAHLSTWRGADDKTKGFLSLLAKSWREEEIRKGVKRSSPEGCIDDVELPVMGLEQWIDAFHARTSRDFSPSLASLLGSVTPKISALRKIMSDESERHSESLGRYKILSNEPVLEDRITGCVADHLDRFARGQVWSEVSRYLERRGVNPLGMDGEIILLMNQRHRDWGVYVRELQEEMLRAEKRRELERERNEFARMRDSRLGDALGALEEIDYARRTCEREYAISRKKDQRDRVNAALKFPDLSDREHCHRTFYDRSNLTVLVSLASNLNIQPYPDGQTRCENSHVSIIVTRRHHTAAHRDTNMLSFASALRSEMQSEA